MTIGVCWEFFEFTADKYLLTDMQKDTYINTISTVEFDETKSNKTVRLNDIQKVALYDSKGNQIALMDKGYLDIGLHDTMDDLFVNLIGATVFSILGYCYILNSKKYKFAKNFIPIKTVEYKKYAPGKYTKKNK